MNTDSGKAPASVGFNKIGYIPLTEYIADYKSAMGKQLWRLPLRFFDRVHFFALVLFARYSWFSASLHLTHQYHESPFFRDLLGYFRRYKMYDIFFERQSHFPGMYVYYFEKNTPLNGKPYFINAQGIADTQELALSKAMGELVERIVTGIGDESKNVFHKSVTELRMKTGNVFYPPDYHNFLLEQKQMFPELYHHKDDLTAWVLGKNLVTGADWYIPKQITSWFEGTRNSKKVFFNATTNGSAAYFTKDGAILRGLLEVVQRDGFLVHWLTMTSPTRIDLATLPENVQDKIRVFLTLGVEIHILNITALAIPTVCVVGISRKSKVPAITVSAASSRSFASAIDDALREMTAAIEVLYRATDVEKNKIFTLANLDKSTRLQYWWGGERLKDFEWFIQGTVVNYDCLVTQDIPEGDDHTVLQALISRLQKFGSGFQPLVYIPKNQFAKKVGMHVVQVFVPKAFPFYLLERYATFESQRLNEFMVSLGKDTFTLNRHPHMFT